MNVEDFAGIVEISDSQSLLDRLASVRHGDFGSFILSHDVNGPSLWVQTNGDLAYLIYFPDASGDHPGFQPVEPPPDADDTPVRFLQIDGIEANGCEIASSATLSAAVAYQAAVEFLGSEELPASITWLEL